MMKRVVCSALVVCLGLTVSAVNFQRTIIAIGSPTVPGEYLFLQGGDKAGNPIPILHNMTVGNARSVYAQTSSGDHFLNWKGRESDQGNYIDSQGRETQSVGTPMIWTTNDRRNKASVDTDGHGYTELNYQGEHLWMADIYMDCDKTSNGWFDFKAYMADLSKGKPDIGWEADLINQEFCIVDGSMWGTQSNLQWDPRNHHGRCGAYNFVLWSRNLCIASPLSHHLMAIEDEWTEDPEPTTE